MKSAVAIVQDFQVLPGTGPKREALREKGQFWTPLWLAKVMAAWVTELRPRTVFDPAVGPGTFFAGARAAGYTGHFEGYELHETSFAEAGRLGLSSGDFERIVVGDFIGARVNRSFPAIVSNPPYIRHHRLSEERKAELRRIAERVLGFPLDGRVGLHVYFLLKCLEHLDSGGRLAFLLPADVCEGISSRAFWNRLCERFRLEAVLTFDESAAPFPKVDTNAIVFLISNHTPQDRIRWIRVQERDGEAIARAVKGLPNAFGSRAALTWTERKLTEALATGLSRPPRPASSQGVPLSNFARIVRGIATGANEFFFLTSEQIAVLGLEMRFFVRAVGRTRDCRDDTLRCSTLTALEAQARPTWLLNLDGTAKESLPTRLRSYLEFGEAQKLNERALIQSRRPWYRMEQRTPPPILFAYLGRRDCRFILNEAGVVPLTGFLCVYPWDARPDAVRRLWRALNHPATLENLAFAGKSYGGGALKVEPRQLDTLEIPQAFLDEVGLESPPVATELMLFERPTKQVHRRPMPEDKGRARVARRSRGTSGKDQQV
jgi:hypothetical protein